jgi:phosphoribosylglycinamide formyltransferase-1
LHNLLATLTDERFGAQALAGAQRDAAALGLRLARTHGPDERLAAWIDGAFAPSWWSSEARAGDAWYAETASGEIVGFAAFGARDLRFPWLRAYRTRPGVGIFGPYGVAPAHRKTGAGAALLTAALASLRDAGYTDALIPAVGGDALVASYVTRTGAQIVDTFDLRAPRRFRTTILASGGGRHAQNVVLRSAAGELPLDVTAIISNVATAGVLMFAREAGVAGEAVVWDRKAECRAAYDARVIAAVAATQPDLVLLLGWMHLLPPAFIERFPEMLNVHPAFLPFDPAADDVVMPDGSRIPAFRGAHAMRDAIAAGVAWTGASVHRVTAETDRGEIVVRTPFSLAGITDEATLVDRLRPVEQAAVVSAIRRWVFEQIA